MTPLTARKLASYTSFRVRSLGKSTLRRIAPDLGERLRRAYWKHRMRGVPRALQLIVAETGMIVRGGPFRQMQLEHVFSGSSLLPKLVGSYEDELNEAVDSVVADNYATIIDVGSAEGYYAVGFALRCPQAKIFAFDINPEAQEHLQVLAELNGVANRIDIGGLCSHDVLQEIVEGKTFILCDIEGAERDLLDPVRSPSLLNCAILVETHTHVYPDIVTVLESRFSESHNLCRYTSTTKLPADYTDLQFLPPNLRQVALDEMRVPGQVWLWMVPRDASALRPEV